jgi:mRNA-degrading endonuclease RelE of RelBE toxin-antitoxin system
LSYPVTFEDEAIADVQALPDRETKVAALRVARDLGENPYLGDRLRNRSRIGDLTTCRAVRFDKEGRRGKPRYRLVYYNDPDDGSVAVVRVIAVGLRAQLEAYKAAAARLRRERREQFGA